jgi:5-oxoprolinase (ATP-hydrolysing)
MKHTEVSQRLTDVLIKALKLAACSQGTMNNFLFGDPTFGYYETIGGGVGAGKTFSGADAVHHHMTNTRITDVEVLEWRYPVRVERFEIRRGSGGRGKHRGGNGIIREFYFKRELEVNLLTQHRVVAPFGLNGGLPGKTGEQQLIRANGTRVMLDGIDSVRVRPGDRVIIKTPGGGAWGKPTQ